MKERLAKLLFQKRFPRGRITLCDMRFGDDAKLVHLSVCPANRLRGTDRERQVAYRRRRDVFALSRRFASCIESNDRLQVFVGYKAPPCCPLHGSITVEELHSAVSKPNEPSGG